MGVRVAHTHTYTVSSLADDIFSGFSLLKWQEEEWNTLQKFDVLEALVHWIDREFYGFDEPADVWDEILQIVLKNYVSQHEPPPNMWAEIKTKVQREVVLNQVHSCVP